MTAHQPGNRLAAVLTAFGLHPAAVRTVGGGFSGARIWHIETSDGQSVALRQSTATDSAELARRTAICRWMHFAREDGCDWAPQLFRPQHSTTSDRCGEFLLLQPDGLWQVESWMPGHAVETRPAPEQLRMALAAVTHLHHTGRCRALQDSREFGVPQTDNLRLAAAPSPGLQRRLFIVHDLQSGALARLLATAATDPDREFRSLAEQLGRCLQTRLGRLAQHLEKLAPHTFTLQPVLRDLWYPHVLFSGDRVSGLIDWNAAATDHPLFDYSRLLGSWYGWEAAPLLHSLAATTAEQQLSAVCLEASLLLAPVTWLNRRCTSPRPLSPVQPEILQRFRAVVQTAVEGG